MDTLGGDPPAPSTPAAGAETDGIVAPAAPDGAPALADRSALVDRPARAAAAEVTPLGSSGINPQVLTGALKQQRQKQGAAFQTLLQPEAHDRVSAPRPPPAIAAPESSVIRAGVEIPIGCPKESLLLNRLSG